LFLLTLSKSSSSLPQLLRMFGYYLVLVFAIMTPSFAQVAPSEERNEAEIRLFDIELTALKERFSANDVDEQALVKIRTDANELLTTARERLATYNAEIADTSNQLLALGDAPAEDAPAEAGAITLERNNLNASSALLAVYIRRVDNVIDTTQDLIFDVGILRRDIFNKALFERVNLSDYSISKAHLSLVEEFSKFWTKISASSSFVWGFKKQALFISLGLSILAGLIIFFGGYRYFGHLILNSGTIKDEQETYGRRLTSAFWSAAIPTLTAAAVGGSTYFLLLDFGVLRIDLASLFARIVQALVALVLVFNLASEILGPHSGRSRLVALTDSGAKSLYILVGLVITIQAISYVGLGVREILDLSLQNSVLQAFWETIFVAIVIIIVSRLSPVVPVNGDVSGKGVAWPAWIRIPLLLLGGLLIVTSLYGYVALAAFSATQFVFTGALMIVSYFGLQSAKSIMLEDAFAQSPLGQALSRSFNLSQKVLDRTGLILGIVLYMLVLGFGISLILLQWGFQRQEVTSGALGLLTQLQIGGITISFVNIGIGLALFAFGYFATNKFQLWVDRNVLGRGQVETGVRNSIRKVIGYFGIAIAAMLAVSAAGFDLSNLALVAGALSLGIGFGLQTIVSNFVSGLILLAERPFKAGDWVETASVQGIVKEISVRATEIETFSRKSVIVPNSELVNAAVGNWTHRNPIGRVNVLIGVSYDNSPRKIMDMLLDIARANPRILSFPEPSVEFVDFGASSLDFSIRGFLANIGDGFDVRNELRVAIYDRFKEEGIEIPYPHQEVYFRNAQTLPEGADHPAVEPKIADDI
jgi:potassium efflux system protein